MRSIGIEALAIASFQHTRYLGKAFELPEWFRISLTANDDMVERALQGFKQALKTTLTATA